jgi:carbon monoxide dehydrogenase subunit G
MKGVLNMVNVETSIVINRPIEEVFAYLTDARNSRQWDSGLVDIWQTPESPVGVGTRITEVRTFLGRKFETTSEVAEYEPPTKYTRKGLEGPFPITGSLTFEPTAQGTKLTWMFEMQPGGFFALAGPLFARSLRRNIEAALGDVKDLLENRTAGVSS